jgi:hypothetical protein
MSSTVKFQLSADQVIALAPDAGAAQSSRGLAQARQWLWLAHAPGVIWGECQGSAAQPYQTQVDLNGPAFQCSCPSRKRPCKHSLGLLLLFTDQPHRFSTAQPPAWVADWLGSRARPMARYPAPPVAPPPAPVSPDNAAQARRAAARQSQREAKIAAGLDELELWLSDLVRRGLAQAQEQPPRYWDHMAARMVDAQAPGLARRLRDLASLPSTGPGWQERLAEQVGRLYLLVEGYRRQTSQPPEVQADLRAGVGWAVSQELVLAQPGVRDRWLVLGQRIEQEERLRARHTWLWGQRTGRAALLLDFAAAGHDLEAGLLPGLEADLTLAFYPSAYPLRAAIKHKYAVQPLAGMPAGYPSLAAAAEAYGTALGRHPGLETFPVALSEVRLAAHAERLWVRDRAGSAWPLSLRFAAYWRLQALSGGHPVSVFGEWDGHSLWPLSVWAGGRLVPLHVARSFKIASGPARLVE